ncbi:MAG: SPOR domain-containing protein [Alphaproteobacteria bacterium]|nr:SPOR domain-containing protein [Alphaproteobacteria bacterium]
MPNSTEQHSSSDDLIAELARLMAEEAQGERDAALARNNPSSARPAPEPRPAAEKPAEPVHRLPGSGNVVRIPGSRPGAEPVGSVWGRTLDATPAANKDVVAAFEPVTPSPVATARPEPEIAPAPVTPAPSAADGADDFLLSLGIGPARPRGAAPRFAEESEPDATDGRVATEAELDTFAVQPEPRAKGPSAFVDEMLDFETPVRHDPIAELIAEQAREEAEAARAAAPEPTPAAEQPSREASASSAFASIFGGRRQPQNEPPPPRPATVRPTSRSTDPGELDSNVLSLLRAMDASHAASASAAFTRPAPDDDHFSASPIFGPGNAKASAPRSADPLDDIESLIGDAVNLTHARTGTKVAVDVEPDFDDAAFAAEAAIAAATAETARPERQRSRPDPVAADLPPRLDSAFAAPMDGEPETPRTGQGNNRLVVAAAAATTVVVAVALGLFWMFGSSPAPDGNVPVLTSNTVDAKESVTQNTESAGTTQPVIFEDATTAEAEAGANEQIVSRDQSDAVAEDVRQVATADTAEQGLANRKVRTVTVRPDGSIVSSDDAVAASDVLPVERPDVPALSSDAGAPGDFQVSTAPIAADPAVSDASATPEGAAGDPLASLLADATATDAGTTGEVVANAPFPTPRPVDAQFTAAATAAPGVTVTFPATGAVSAGNGTTTVPATAPSSGGSNDTIDLIAERANQVAAQLPTATGTAPATTAASGAAPATTAIAAVATTAGPTAPAYVQLSSQRSEVAAQQSLAGINQRFGSLFGGAEAFVRSVDLGERGIYYRVLVPANSQADANGLCTSVKLAGGDCFVRNN